MASGTYAPPAEQTEQERETVFMALSITEKRVGVAAYSNYTCILDLTEVFAFSSDLLDVILHGGFVLPVFLLVLQKHLLNAKFTDRCMDRLQLDHQSSSIATHQ